MRVLRWAAGILGVLVIAGVLFLLFGLNTLRGPIQRAVSDATGRELVIERIEPKWDWVHPRFRLEGVSFANPEWAQESYLLRAEAIEATVSVLPLFTGRVVLPELHLQKPALALEQDAEGRKSWVLDSEDTDEESRVLVKRLTVDQGHAIYLDAEKGIAVNADIATDADGVVFAANGDYKGMPFEASGHGGEVLPLRDNPGTPFPLKANARFGDTSIAIDGHAAELQELSGIDTRFEVSGESMEALYQVFGFPAPSTGPYRMSGRLVRDGKLLRVEEFSGRIGESDLTGTLVVDNGGSKPVIQADLQTKVLNFSDLGALVGTRDDGEDRVLPNMPFNPDRWDRLEADVTLKAGTIKRPEALPIENLHTRITMKDSVLSLDPLAFGVAGGRIAGPLRLDGRERTIKADATIRIDKLQLARLMPTLDEAKASVGSLNGAIELKGTGNSVADMLGSSNGKVGVFMEGGRVNEALMQLAAINLWGYGKAKLKGDQRVPIRCVVGDFGVKGGLMQTNALVADTEVVVVHGEGSVNLKNEALNLTLRAQPKEFSLASLRTPLYIRGTFSDPEVGVNVGQLAAKGAGAIVMGIINPLLAVLPLIDAGPGKDSPCGQLVAEIASKTRNVRSEAATSSGQSSTSGATAPRPPSQSGR